MLLMAYWLWALTGWLWRRAIQAEAGSLIRAAHDELGGRLEPTWRGYRLRLDGARIEWRGTVMGPRTILVRGGLRWTRPGLCGLEDLTAPESGEG